MEIRPDKKLLCKYRLILLTIIILVLFIFLILQLTIPLDGHISPGELARIIWPIAGIIIFILCVIYLTVSTLWVKNLSYFIEEDRVVVVKGILTKKQQNIPYRAITDFMLQRSLYDRIFGIGEIRIQTAGQSRSPSGYEGQLSGLLEYEELHKQLRGKLLSMHSGGEAVAISGITASSGSDDIQQQILQELKGIRQALEKK